MDRRAFIKLTAVTGTTATLASCGNPEHELIRFIPEDEITPGVAEWKPSVCPLCRAGCGVQVRVMDADVDVIRDGQRGVTRMNVAKKLEGNGAHPISQGKLCARGQAAIQVTYHPDRLTGPMKRSGARGSGQFTAITWDEAIAALLAQLDRLAAAGNQRALAFWMRPERSHRQQLAAEFLRRFGAPPPLMYEFFDDGVLRRANLLSFGREQLPTFDLARSRYVLSFGADFLGTWNSPVAQGVAYGQMRQGRRGVRGKFVQVEPRMSQTGANADEWVPAKPGTEGILALGLAHVIIADKLRTAASAGAAGALIDGWSDGLSAYAPAEVERRTGVAAARVERLARELAEVQPAVAIIGGAPIAHTNGLSQALAVNALNALLGAVGQPGGLLFTPQPALAPLAKELRSSEAPAAALSAPDKVDSVDRVDGADRLDRMAAQILSNQRPPLEVLLVDGTNPVFGSPSAWRVREAIEKVPFVASFGSFLDETSVLADLILPDHSFLESWTDSIAESGSSAAVLSAAAPVMRPLHQTRATPDVLLDVGRRLKRPLNPPLPWQTFDELIQAGFGEAWSNVQTQGGLWGDALGPASVSAPTVKPAARRGAALTDPVFDGSAPEYAFHFLPYASSAFFDGSAAHLPWLQEDRKSVV